MDTEVTQTCPFYSQHWPEPGAQPGLRERNRGAKKQLLLHTRLGLLRIEPDEQRSTMAWEGGRDSGVTLRGDALLQEVGEWPEEDVGSREGTPC